MLKAFPLLFGAMLSGSLWIMGCTSTDPGRDNSADEYDKFIGEVPKSLLQIDTDPEGRLHMLISMQQIFVASRPNPNLYSSRFRARNEAQYLWVYADGKWTSTALQTSGYSNMNVRRDPNNLYEMPAFLKNAAGYPVLMARSRLQPAYFAFNAGQWQRRWQRSQVLPEDYSCTPILGTESDQILKVCDVFIYPPNPIPGTRPKIEVHLRELDGNEKVLFSDSTLNELQNIHCRRDTLDLLFSTYNSNLPSPLGKSGVRLIRYPGKSFTDTSTLTQVFLLPASANHFLVGDTVTRVVHFKDAQPVGTTLFGTNDSIGGTSFKAWDLPDIQVTTQVKSGPDGCPLWYSVREEVDLDTSPDSNKGGITISPVVKKQAGSNLAATRHPFGIDFGCGPHSDTLFYTKDVEIRGNSDSRSALPTTKGEIFAATYSNFNEWDFENGFGLTQIRTVPDDTLTAEMRKYFSLQLWHWKGGSWEKLSLPF